MRKISFKLLTQSSLVSIETSARTFGELKTAVSEAGLGDAVSFANNQFIDKATKVAYSKIDDAVLPATECILFVVPLQTKSGVDVDSMTYLQVRDYVSELNKTQGAKISIIGSAETLRNKVKEFLGANEPVPSVDMKACLQAIREACTTILDQVDVLESMPVSTPEEVAFSVTLKELQNEAENLKKILG